MEETEERLKNIKKTNVRLYPKYKMISWDALFYYSIIFLFFTQEKGISAADVLLAESFYPLFKFLLSIPATLLIDKIGKRKSLIIGNMAIALSILTYIVATSFKIIIVGEFFSAIGYIIKGICESNVLYDSLERNEKRGALFSKIEGRAVSIYYYLDAISSVAAGFLFIINSYLPMVFSLLINIISVIMSLAFGETEETRKKDKIHIKKELINLNDSMQQIFESPRLRNLLIFGALFSGLLSVLVTLRSSLLSDFNVPAQYFGIIFAVFGIISGISAKNQHRIHQKFRNRTLTNLSLPVVVSCIIVGLWCSINFGNISTAIVILIVFLIQYIAKGPFYTLIRQYMNNFTTSSLRTKIASSYNFLDSLFRFTIGFVTSYLLRYTTTANTLAIIGCVFTVIFTLMLDNMKKKVGLKPEEYTSEKDIKILKLK